MREASKPWLANTRRADSKSASRVASVFCWCLLGRPCFLSGPGTEPAGALVLMGLPQLYTFMYARAKLLEGAKWIDAIAPQRRSLFYSVASWWWLAGGRLCRRELRSNPTASGHCHCQGAEARRDRSPLSRRLQAGA